MPGFIGLPEIIALGLLALLLFGPKRLPEMGRGLGKGLREFKSSVTGDDKDEHGFSASKLDIPEELTATPMAVEPVGAEPVAVEHRNVA
jgi:sec-independent protein translocase protein TatA